MTIEAKNKIMELIPNMRGGEGTVELSYFTNTLPPHFRFLGELALKPGCSVGVHEHHGECEVYYVVEGEAILNDNGEERPFRVGDVCICFDGNCHGWRNETDKLVRLFSIVITNE